ncbi:MAG: response regulator transcription factor [Candidatus Nitronauta litoralis]|uniref:Response regulator transcription factor n=1 Tax=Candidatus Nitronauta litoralis TaxID=2705533 RepID=A0A7T0BTY0_9BACT|nr:MAG: response regulator transcription factor [Candidatus Nitronauta litoralis]
MANTKENKIRILIADDHEVVRKGLKTIIADHQDMTVTGEAENGNDVLNIVGKQDFDLILLDFDMPEKNGLDTLIELKALYPKLPVIILSIFPEDHYGTRFLKAGASGYLGKSSASDQLVEAIRKVACGGKYVSPNLADKLVSDLNRDSDKPLHETLTDREFQVFTMIAGGKKLKHIAEELCLSINTISTYRGRILQKMDMKSNADVIHYAIDNHLIA